MLSPELTLEQVQQMVDAARAELAGATMAQEEAERAHENIRRELDERMTAKTAASRKLSDAQALLRMREGLPNDVVRMRKEYGALWAEVNADQEGVASDAQRRRSTFLSKEMRRLCTHPLIITHAASRQRAERYCAVCSLFESVEGDDATFAHGTSELRDMPGRRVAITTWQEFDDLNGAFLDLPDVDAITTRFDALVLSIIAAANVIGDGESG